MTKEQLESYKSKKEELEDLRYRLEQLPHDENLISNDVILDYRKGYPRPQSIVGRDYELEKRRRERWEKKAKELSEEIDEVERWIESIQDSVTRRCFRYVYIDGLSQSRAGRKLNLDRSRVSRKIEKFLKTHTKTQNAQL